MAQRMITIIGPTASGKTALAAALAAEIGGEVLSGDSRQVYRGMDIGTGKDLDDYVVDGRPVAYHLIDIVDAGAKYSLFQYQQDFHKAYEDIRKRGKEAVLCGGSGLYIEAVLRGFALSPVPENPELRAQMAVKSLQELRVELERLKEKNGSNMHNITDVDTVQRAIRAIEIETYNLNHPHEVRRMPAIDTLLIGVKIDRDERRRRISDRLKHRLEHGMIEEVRCLLAKGIPAADLIYYGLEYKYVTEHVTGLLSYEEMYSKLEIAIHQFAKRQMTWFRGMERRGSHIEWIDAALPTDEKIKKIKELW